MPPLKLFTLLTSFILPSPSPSPSSSPPAPLQFRALNYKNFRMRVKHPFKLIFELAVPIAVFYLFIYIRSTMPDKDALENQVLRMNLHQASDVITDYSDWLSNLPNPVCACGSGNFFSDCYLDTNGLDSNPFLSCDYWAGYSFCEYDGQDASAICEVNHMAIVEGTSDRSTEETADAFNAFLTAKFGSFVSKYPIKRFSSEQVREDADADADAHTSTPRKNLTHAIAGTQLLH